MECQTIVVLSRSTEVDLRRVMENIRHVVLPYQRYREYSFILPVRSSATGSQCSSLHKLCPEDWMFPIRVERRIRFGASTIGARFAAAAPLRRTASEYVEGERVTIGYLYMIF